MTALQLNPDIYRQLDIIAEDESMFERVTKYINRIVKQMTYDPTCMTKEEFFARIDRAEQGPSYSFASVEELDRYIRSL